MWSDFAAKQWQSLDCHILEPAWSSALAILVTNNWCRLCLLQSNFGFGKNKANTSYCYATCWSFVVAALIININSGKSLHLWAKWLLPRWCVTKITKTRKFLTRRGTRNNLSLMFRRGKKYFVKRKFMRNFASMSSLFSKYLRHFINSWDVGNILSENHWCCVFPLTKNTKNFCFKKYKLWKSGCLYPVVKRFNFFLSELNKRKPLYKALHFSRVVASQKSIP